MNQEFLDYIEDILEEISKLELLVQTVSFEQFSEDFRINYTAVRALEIIGEAAKRIPAEIRDAYPDIPWREMAGMRDRIVHGYDTIDLLIVWDTVTKRIPSLKIEITRILNDYNS